MISAIKTLKAVLESIPSNPTIKIGYWNEISNDLSLMGLDKSKDGTKFPLIYVNTFCSFDSGEVVRENSFNNIRFYIITEAELNDGFVDRISSTFETTIFPLRDEMIHTMIRSKRFNIAQNSNLLEFEKSEFMYPYLFGEKQNQNKFNEVIDTLEITFKKLRIKTLKP